MRIQREVEKKKILERIVAISEEFFQSADSELNYQKITDNILDISGAKYGCFDLYDEDGSKFRTVALSAPDGIIKKVSSLLGFKLFGKVWEHDPVRAEKIKSHTITHFSTLSELAGDVISKPVVSLLEKILNIGEVVLVKILKENAMIGDFTLIMPGNVKFKNDNYVEVYTRQVGLLITNKKAKEALRESEEKYRSLIERANDGIAVLVDGIIRFSNPSLTAMLGYETGEINGFELARLIQPENLELVLERYRKRIAGEKLSQVFETVLLHKSGNGISVEVSGAVIRYEGKSADLVIMRDITERKKTEEALWESEEIFRRFMEYSPIYVFFKDENVRALRLSKNYETMLGKPVEELLGKSMDDLFPSELAKSMVADDMRIMKKGKVITVEEELNGRFYSTIKFPIFIDGKPRYLAGYTTDITERKNTENKIIYLSYHDQLTGLYNRRFAEEEIKRLDTKRQLPLSVIMGDLNSLKLTNDTFGHSKGDKILKGTAKLLKRMCRSDDILSRWGGDEFVILLPKTSITDSEEIVQRIKKECKKLIIQKIPLSLSIGVATKIEIGQDMDEIIIEAESNMYKNKLVEKESNASSIIFALEQALYEKSNETMEHAFRIKDSAIKLGESIKLPVNQLDELSLLASLHDIGKVAIPETILLKEGKLTEKEWAVIKRHPEIGFNIAQSSPQIIHIAKFILACHENWDGSGYPNGLAGESIPIVSRVISIADAYDVMTSERVYKKAMSKPEAITELKRCAGTQFDPVLVNKFIEIISN